MTNSFKSAIIDLSNEKEVHKLMVKIDKRKHYIIVLDTETCPLDKDFEGVSPFNMFVYDIGWAVVDKKGNVYETKSYINRDIFMDEKALMNSAYYSDKIPKYWEDIKSGKSQRGIQLEKTLLTQ